MGLRGKDAHSTTPIRSRTRHTRYAGHAMEEQETNHAEALIILVVSRSLGFARFVGRCGAIGHFGRLALIALRHNPVALVLPVL